MAFVFTWTWLKLKRFLGNRREILTMDFVITNTNIVRVTADAIVLPANQKLKEGPGCSRAIFSAAGRKELKQACDKYGHCDMGSAVVTLAYNLDADYIIHAVVPKWVDGRHNEYQLLSTAYLTALAYADVMKCRSIAFPLLASGHNGFNPEFSLRIAIDSFKAFKGKNLKTIILVIYGDEAVRIVRKKGLKTVVLPVNLQADKNRWKDKKREELKRNNKMYQFLQNEIDVAMNLMKDPEVVKKLIFDGTEIVKMILESKKG